MDHRDPHTGVLETWHDDGADGLVIVRQQNVADHVDYCKARANEGFHGPAKDFQLMASIPVVVVEHYCRVTGVTLSEFTRNPEHVKRIVNDPAFADLRIAPGVM